MKIGVFTPVQLAGLRPPLDAINTANAKRPSFVGRFAGRRVPESYSPGALGWSVPFTFYPQPSGDTVVSISDEDWDDLPSGVRAQYAASFPLTAYPAGFGVDPR